MTPPSSLPSDPSLRVVDSTSALLTTPFEGDCQALCWERNLLGDFEEVVRLLAPGDGVVSVDDSELIALPASPAGQRAIATLLDDLNMLRAAGHEPELNCVTNYERDPDEDLPTDVYSFHIDSATVPTETFLCTYFGRPSEGLRRADALRTIDVPELRARLLREFGGQDDGSFVNYLRESHHDLHFVPRDDARPISFGVGHLWRVAVQYPGCPVPAFIHRAPPRVEGDGTRLILIS